MTDVLGTTNEFGYPIYPMKTLSGNDYNLKSAILLNVVGGFVVLDLNPPADFDLDAALAAAGLSRPTPPAPVTPDVSASAKVSKKAADAPEPPTT